MAVYLIANVTVTDDAWLPDYAANVHEIVHKHGGKYLARSANVSTLEGEPSDATMIALLEFPSAEAVRAFVDDPAYAPYSQARQAGTARARHRRSPAASRRAADHQPSGRRHQGWCQAAA